MGRPYKRITEQVFNGVKAMLKGGASQKEAAGYAGVCVNTVYRIQKAASYDEYLGYAYANGRNAYPAENPHNKQETKQTVIVQATWQMTQEMQNTNKLLEQISNKLAFIIDELCGVKTNNAEPNN